MAPEAATLDLITKAMVKTYFGITDTDNDDKIDNHLLGVREYVKGFCRNDFQSTTRTAEKPYIKTVDNSFYLRHYPVASITSLTEDGEALTENTDFYVDKDTGRVDKISTTNNIANPDRNTDEGWDSEANSVSVTYVGGEAITDEIIMVVKELVGISAGIKKRTYTDNEGIERVATMTNPPTFIMDTMKRHRKRRWAR